MIDIDNLTSDVFSFISSNKDTAPPLLLEPSLRDVTPLIEDWKQKPKNAQTIQKLAKYCGFYEDYLLANRLLNFVIQLYPERPQYHYFQAILYFKQNNIPDTLLAIEKMLHIMRASDTQKKHLLDRLHDGNKINHCIFFVDRLLKEFNLPLTNHDFNILLLPYDMKHKDKITRYYYNVYFTQLCDNLKWQKNSQLTTLLEAEKQLNQESPWYHFNIAKLHWILHHRELCDFHFQKAKSLAIEENMILDTENCGVYTWLSHQEVHNLPEVEENNDPFQLKMWQWSYADLKGANPDLSIILGCDFKYFKYFPKFIFSLLKAHIQNDHQEKTIISICLDNPSIEQIQFLHHITEYIHEHIPNFYLTFGYGICPYQDGAYFASIRYLFAPELFELYPTKTFIVDIDAYAYPDFYSKVKAIKEKYDFGLRTYAFDKHGNQISGEPWHLGAGILYLGDLEKTRSILKFLKQYVNYAYDRKNPINWYIDQCALVQAFYYYIRPFWDTLRIINIDETAPFLLSQIVGEKDQFYRHGEIIDLDNFIETLEPLIH